jgi:hypothetical protein
LIILGVALVLIGLAALVGGSPENQTNATKEMQFGDKWSCGYINTTTTLESLRNCFRD